MPVLKEMALFLMFEYEMMDTKYKFFSQISAKEENMKATIKNEKECYVLKNQWIIKMRPFLLTAIFLAGSWGTGFSQPPEKFGPPFDRPRFKEGRCPPISSEDREALRKRINMIKMWRLAEELDLS